MSYKSNMPTKLYVDPLCGRTWTASCCLGLRLSGTVMVNLSVPLSSSESAFCPDRNWRGMIPIPTSWFLCSFSKLSAMTARTPCQPPESR